jgi:prepilin-type N-terminal cleavage/methylation domain-containing protein
MPGQRGVTLIELLIAITLVAALSTGMLMAMRISLNTLEKTQGRLEDNRRAMGVQQLILRQIGGVIPVTTNCGPARIPAFIGTEQALHLVTSYSLNEGARGYPRLVGYQVLAEPPGTFQLIMNEYLYSGPAVSAEMCTGRQFAPERAGPATVVLATGLAYCRFFYKVLNPEAIDQGNWVPAWNRANLPQAVRIEMAPRFPNPARLPMVSLHVPIHVTRDVLGAYVDQ